MTRPIGRIATGPRESVSMEATQGIPAPPNAGSTMLRETVPAL
ncbi:MAG: hypothetical protein ABW224_12425 [Kibdelosporangium sp.]